MPRGGHVSLTAALRASVSAHQAGVQYLRSLGPWHQVPVEVRSTHYELLTIRGGLIVRIREYYDKAQALEAAGLRE